jgi:hypothetical protein
MEQQPQLQPMKPQPQPMAGPIPMKRPGAPAGATAKKRTGIKALVGALLFVGVVGIGAVATGLIQVPGLNTAPQTMSATPSTQSNPAQISDDGSKTVGAGLTIVTPQLIKSHGLNTKTEGYLVTAIIAGSPAEEAHLQVNDIVVAIDGVAIGNNADMWTIKTNMTAIGEKMRLTIERNGAIQDVPVQIGRCSIPSSQRPPRTLCPAGAIVK